MGLFVDIDEGYTKTGKGTLTRWSNALSYLPRWINFESMKKIPVIGMFINGTLTAALGAVSTVVETLDWVRQGKFGSAATVLASGAVGTAVNAAQNVPFFWAANAASGISTGETLGTHARALTESIIGGVSGALGSKPEVLRSHTATIGSIGSGTPASGIGRRDGFVAAEGARRGQSADEAWARANSDPSHVAALEAAAQQQSGYRTV